MQSINDFLSVKELAIAGVTRDKKKFGFAVFQELRKKGFKLFPINPFAESIDDLRCYNSVLELPEGTKNLYIVTPKDKTTGVIKHAITKGIQNIWIQQKSDTPEALKLAEENGINLIHGECMFMHISPDQSFHKFHRFLRKLFGGMPS